MNEDLTIEQWLAEMETPSDGKGRTLRELGSACGLGEDAIRKRIWKAQAMGLVEVSREWRTNIVGSKTLVPVYRFKRKES